MTRDPRRGDAAEPPARGSRAIAILTQPTFVLAVALLLLNDWVFKPAYGTWWTGKLSDVAGLFAFPLLWSALLPRGRRAIFAVTAIGFLAWKSPLSGPPLAAWNALGMWPLTRIVDYTDWIALAVLIPSYRLAVRAAPDAWRGWPLLARRAGAAAAAAIALIAFTATSRVVPTYPLGPQTGYPVGAHQNQIRAAFDDLGIPRRAWARADAMADTLALVIGKTAPRRMSVAVELRDGATCGTIITPLSAAVGGKAPNLDAVRELFFKEVIEPLRARFRPC